jgi:lipid II:glycine glycyltransferase (peptidoglycan interpeptide bridge formation enzyme)
MVFLVCGERAEYHINASIAKGRDASAWLIWQALRALKERGVRQLNLGGGAKPGDGLYDFKAKFGGTAMRLRYVKQIYDAEAYDRLCREEETSSEESWFPAYRARHGRLPFV